MPDFSWMAKEDELSPAALTVRAQALSPNDNGTLLWDTYFPRKDVDSTSLHEIATLDFRPVADRREWNQRGRYIPVLTPPMRDMKMVPIEAYFRLEEEEIQKLTERTLGNEALFRRLIGASVPERSDALAQADYRRLELDAMTAWAAGTITQKNPQNGGTYSASFGFDAGRYQVAGTAWNDASVNAYTELLAWLRDGMDAVGSVAGVLLRYATVAAIVEDAPTGALGVALTQAQVQDRISQELGQAFQFRIVEESVDTFTDGGVAYTRQKIWPAQKVALVPAGVSVGNAAFAPVARAMELSQQVPAAKIDIRGVTIYHEIGNGGRELTVEGQVNAMPIPDEGKIWIMDAGV